MYKLPSVTKIIWKSLPEKERIKLKKYSEDKNKKIGEGYHQQILNCNILYWNDEFLDIEHLFGKCLYKEKFFTSKDNKYCGKIDYFTNDNHLIEWKFIKNKKNLDLKLNKAKLQLGAYYNFVKDFPYVTGEIIFFCLDNMEIKRFRFTNNELINLEKSFSSLVVNYYGFL